MTIMAWVIVGLVLIGGLAAFIVAKITDYVEAGVFGLFITIILACGLILCFTVTKKHAYKDYESNRGVNREIIITAEDGREIYRWAGRCNIEDADGYILFEDENNKRHIIYYGALDTIIIEEK